MHNHLHQNQNQCVEQPSRMLANGPNHPGPGAEEIPMVDVSPNSRNTQQMQVQVILRSGLTDRLEVKSPPDNPACHAEEEPTTGHSRQTRGFLRGRAALEAEINK